MNDAYIKFFFRVCEEDSAYFCKVPKSNGGHYFCQKNNTGSQYIKCTLLIPNIFFLSSIPNIKVKIEAIKSIPIFCNYGKQNFMLLHSIFLLNKRSDLKVTD